LFFAGSRLGLLVLMLVQQFRQPVRLR